MDKLATIQNEVEQTLNSLNGLSRAEASPFFYTRLTARMESAPLSVWTRALAFLSQPAVSLSLLFFFLVLNGYLVFSSLQENEEAGSTQEYVAQQISYFDTPNNP